MKTYSITDTGILREMNQDYFSRRMNPLGISRICTLLQMAWGDTRQEITHRVTQRSASLHPCLGVREKNQLQF